MVDIQATFLTVAVTILVTGIFVHWAAKLVLDESRYVQAILAVVGGGLLAGIVEAGADRVGWPDMAALVLALAGYALVTALVYRTKWVKGAIVGVVAWLLYAAVRLVVRAVAG